MKPTYQELETELSQTKSLLKEAFEMIAALQKEVRELKEQLNKNSKNSSKPPSSDQKANTPNEPKKPRKSRKGYNRPLFPKERVDKTIECCVEHCPCCGSTTLDSSKTIDVLHQVELPEVRAIVTEYILKKSRCNSCNHTSYGQLPLGIPYSAFGSKLMGLIGTLTGAFHIAKREAIQLIKDLYDIDIGLGSIPNIEERISHALDPVYQMIHEFVLESDFSKHFDETVWRNSGKRHYVWLASCNHAAVYMIDRCRNTQAFQKLIKNKDLKNKLSVSDRYSLYKRLGDRHQYCLAHLIRDFRKFGEREGPDKPIGRSIEQALSKACSIHKKYREGKINLTQRNRRLGHVRKRAEWWFYEGLANGSDELSGLCNRLLNEFEKLWTFSKETELEPTNNLAERDLRKLVIWRKKSYGTRSDNGQRFVERITSVIQTLRKKKKNALKFIQEALTAFYKKEKPPQICSEMGF